MPMVNGIPTYGNWGGPGWSGGRRTYGDPLTDKDKGCPAIDKLGELFREHDLLAYEDANGKDAATAARMREQADRDLLDGMLALDGSQPGTYREGGMPELSGSAGVQGWLYAPKDWTVASGLRYHLYLQSGRACRGLAFADRRRGID